MATPSKTLAWLAPRSVRVYPRSWTHSLPLQPLPGRFHPRSGGPVAPLTGGGFAPLGRRHPSWGDPPPPPPLGVGGSAASDEPPPPGGMVLPSPFRGASCGGPVRPEAGLSTPDASDLPPTLLPLGWGGSGGRGVSGRPSSGASWDRPASEPSGPASGTTSDRPASGE